MLDTSSIFNNYCNILCIKSIYMHICGCIMYVYVCIYVYTYTRTPKGTYYICAYI